MRDVLSIHMGQCGIQLGADFWKQILFEEMLTSDGSPLDRTNDSWNHNTFFDETSVLTYTPRALFIDSESQVVNDVINNGPMSRLVGQENLICHNQSSSGVYSRAKFLVAKALAQNIMHGLRRVIERSECLDSIYAYSSLCGGTGSGLMTYVNNLVKDVVPKVHNYHHAVLPSQTLDTGTLAPYNAILHLAESRSSVNLRCIYNNEAIYNLLEPIMPDRAKCINYSDINYLISLIPSHITRGVRSSGKLTVNLDSSDHLMNNLVPFPTLSNVSTAIIPLRKKACKTVPTMVSLTSEAFLNYQEMCNIEIHQGKYMACCLHYCGDVNVKECHDVVADVRSEFHIPFVSWIPTGFKITMDPQQTTHPAHKDYIANSPMTLLKISNHTSIASAISHIVQKYDTLLENRAFVWWYIMEGMEEGEFSDAQETVLADLQVAEDVAADNLAGGEEE